MHHRHLWTISLGATGPSAMYLAELNQRDGVWDAQKLADFFFFLEGWDSYAPNVWYVYIYIYLSTFALDIWDQCR